MDRAPSRSSESPLLFRRSPPDPRAAFSLVELMVALAIIGIAAALGLPRIADVANQNRVSRGAQALQIEVQQAFAIAGRNRTPVRLRWDAASVEMQITNLAGNTIFRRASLRGYGLGATDVSSSPAVLTVFPNGIAADSLVIRLSRAGHLRSVHVSRAGMIRIK